MTSESSWKKMPILRMLPTRREFHYGCLEWGQDIRRLIAVSSPYHRLFKLPHFLRVLTHLIILYRSAGLGEISQDDANFIIKTYVDMFMATNAQPPRVLAPYIAELPAHDQVLSFATLLSRLHTSQAMKAELLKLASDYNMDRFSIAAKTVELVVDGDREIAPQDAGHELDEEARQIDSIGWLTIDKELHTQAALRSHQVCRRFLSAYSAVPRGLQSSKSLRLTLLALVLQFVTDWHQLGNCWIRFLPTSSTLSFFERFPKARISSPSCKAWATLSNDWTSTWRWRVSFCGNWSQRSKIMPSGNER